MLKIKTKVILTVLLMTVILIGFIPLQAYADTNLVEEDKTKPVMDYAYVEHGWLRFSISDNHLLARKPIEYRIDKEYRTYEIDVTDYYHEYNDGKIVGRIYDIKVEVPSTISLIVKDYAGNESTYNYSIKEDNSSLTKYVPEFILERLARNRQSKVNKFKGFEDIFELEYGKIIDAFSLYDRVIKTVYNSYNKNDIKFKVAGLTTDRDGNIKLDKYGVFKVTMTHSKDKTFEESAYILIKPDWKNIEDRTSPINVSPYIVYKDKMKVADYFIYEDEIGGDKSKSKIDTSYMLVYNEDTDQISGMNDQISLELNKVYKLSVLNFESNSEHDFYVMRQEKIQLKNKVFSDVDANYWASNEIGSLVSKGLLSGYPDGNFNPKGNITIKEFMTILSRQIALNPAKGNPIVGNVILQTKTGSWGYIESKSILDRIPSSELFKFNYINMDRPINREEVAFLIKNALEMGIVYNTNMNKPLTDLATSEFYSEITNLVNQGFISGYPDGTFKPKSLITRAEAATIFSRIK